ncbi:MAG: helix-turn-helix domain-containing protein [Candidatus Pacearchaeota archaeon]
MTKKETRTLYFELKTGLFDFIPNFLKEEEPNLAEASAFRNMLSKEKARILFYLKREKIKSIYDLAKKLNRDFKSVYSDLRVLEKYGIIEFIEEKKGKKVMYKPVLLVDKIELVLKI